MFIEVAKGIPVWVYGLFFGLLLLGWLQSRNRIVGRGRIFLLPTAMVALSIYSATAAFGAVAAVLGAWALGLAVAVAAGLSLGPPRGAAYLEAQRAFAVPGSWVPLGLMMAIFLTRFVVGFSLARQLPMAGQADFMAGAGFLYGALSGLFLARALNLWRVARAPGTLAAAA